VRVIGVDLGSRRIGVAVSDRTGMLASPLVVLERSGDRGRDHRALARLVAEEEAERVVVGLPLSLDGATGTAAQAALEEVAELAKAVGVPVDTHDERLSTVSADRSLIAQGMRGPARRRVIDKVAASVILQSWLDSPVARALRQPERDSVPPPDPPASGIESRSTGAGHQ
jgi:putative Holliday junction resolvase